MSHPLRTIPTMQEEQEVRGLRAHMEPTPGQRSLFDEPERNYVVVTDLGTDGTLVPKTFDFTDKAVGTWDWDVWVASAALRDIPALREALSRLTAWAECKATPRPLRTRAAWVRKRALTLAEVWSPGIVARIGKVEECSPETIEVLVEHSRGAIRRVEMPGMSWLMRRPALRYNRNRRPAVEQILAFTRDYRSRHRRVRRGTPSTERVLVGTAS